MNNLLEVHDLQVEFQLHQQGSVHAVRGVSFRVRPGSTVALVGESGSGKSVISQSIMGILPQAARITGGSILFNDGNSDVVDIAKLDADGSEMRDIRGGRISMIFQEPMTSLSPLHTIGSQIQEAVLLHRSVSDAEARELAGDMLRMVGFPAPPRALRTYPFELSGGLRQRAMIAMALICHPALLIADEPTTALDVTIQAQTLKLIGDLQTELGMAMLLITHDLGVVANMADEVVVVYHGDLIERGNVADIFGSPKHDYLKALMRAVPRMGMAGGERLTPIREVARVEDSHLDRKQPWTEVDEAAGPLLDVRNVRKSFRVRSQGMFASGGSLVPALNDVSLYIARGECLGLVGESGCGKTTLSKIILRVLEADTGEITYNDRGKLVDLRALSDDELITYRRKIQFVFQDPVSSLNPRMTVFDIISEPLTIHGMQSREQRVEVVKELMRHVGLDPRFLARYPHSFSGGQRQRIGIARALALGPELLICDEPVSALDVSVQAQILNLLKDLQSELSLTYLFISHNLAVVDYMADRIAVMCQGHLVETAHREAIFADPVHPYTKALLNAVPRAELDQPLDLAALMEGKASDPSAWPAPFGVTGGTTPSLVQVSEGHYVRAEPSIVAETHAS
ncbi:MAG: dipeptide ABC transporter ATP-binding protein [Gammaproteobacteria bacterium]|nr:dipeptide ABC transporter ATP-binding protein [Gammaproteobacteria bacterium]